MQTSSVLTSSTLQTPKHLTIGVQSQAMKQKPLIPTHLPTCLPPAWPQTGKAGGTNCGLDVGTVESVSMPHDSTQHTGLQSLAGPQCVLWVSVSVCLSVRGNQRLWTDWGFEPMTVLLSFSGLPTKSRQQGTENGLGGHPFGSRLCSDLSWALAQPCCVSVSCLRRRLTRLTLPRANRKPRERARHARGLLSTGQKVAN